jgi:hypothetical protein
MSRRGSNEFACEVGSFRQILSYLETVQDTFDTGTIIAESAKRLGVKTFYAASPIIIVVPSRHLGSPHFHDYTPAVRVFYLHVQLEVW